MTYLPPVSLYIHIPWCVQKCPYCDFNSHGQKGAIPEQEYIAHLLDDLERDATLLQGRPIETIFIGGGTPSLLSEAAMDRLLSGVRQRVELSPQAEITMEANPGTLETDKFKGFAESGINRISIGVQSFEPQHLAVLGRIHDKHQALNAAGYARQAGLNSFNLDLMHGLPEQSLSQAMQDLETAIDQAPPHLSWYQLTIEPNTQFASKPPSLPDDDVLWDIQQAGHQKLLLAGYQQYEISGYSKPGFQCQHNLNYWRYGDYLGIGCGAHGKVTFADGTIQRMSKIKHPRGYMQIGKDYLYQQDPVAPEDRPFEFFMNRFRLLEACPKRDYTRLTGLSVDQFDTASKLRRAIDMGLLAEQPDHWQVTSQGRRYLNSLLEMMV